MSNERVPASVSASPDPPGGSPGSILRRCREFHGISLEEASETTKIGISHLKALEEDQIHEFANRAYLKGFLRIYTTYLGLNSDDIARMYDKLFGVRGEKQDTAISPTPARPPHRLITLNKLILPAFLLAVILIIATFFKRPPPPLVRQPQSASVTVPAGPKAAVQTAQTSVRTRKSGQEDSIPKKAESAPPKVPEEEQKIAEKRPAEVKRGFILKIRVTQNGSLTATVDGLGAQRYDLATGDVIEWKAEKKVTLELSNAGGVDLELNGSPYRSLGPPGKPVYVELDADGVKQ